VPGRPRDRLATIEARAARRRWQRPSCGSCRCCPRTCRSLKSRPSCSCRHTPSSRRWSRSTASWVPPPVPRRSPGPGNWAPGPL